MHKWAEIYLQVAAGHIQLDDTMVAVHCCNQYNLMHTC